MKKKSWLFLLFLFLVTILSVLYLKQDFEKASSTLYINGNIITLNEQAPNANAMLVADGKILEIGNQIDFENIDSKDFITIDLQGATVMPGFIDPHTHFALSMFLSSMYDLSGFKHNSNQEVWDYFESLVKTKEKGEWIICKGIDPILIPDLKTPTLNYLDKIAPNNPVVIFSQSLHSYWVNSKTFEKAGIEKDTPNPSQHSYYEKNKAGDFTGLIVEQEAFKPITDVMAEEVLTSELLSNAATNVMRDYLKNGNTSIVTTGLTINDSKPLILLKHLSAESPSLLGNLLATVGTLPKREPAPRHFIYMRHDRENLLPQKREVKNDFYDIIGVKHWYDGSPYIGTMYMENPYLESKLTNEDLSIPKHHHGEALITSSDLKSFIQKHHNNGYQIAIHTQGNAAISEVLDVYQELESELDFKNTRHRLEHCLLLPKKDLGRMKKLNITPSFHINHLLYYGDALKTDLLGEERTNEILPIHSTQNMGIKYTLHADQPMFESNPFRLIQTAVERKTRSGIQIGEEEKIELMDAIKSLTIDAAWQINMEDKIGSLEKGKYADFIILDKNPFETPIQELENIKCKKVFVNGNETKK